MNEKLTLLLTFVLFSILPTMANSNWVNLGNGSYIDMNVEKYNYNRSNYGNYYTVWLKYLNDCNNIFNDFNTGQCRKDISYVLVHHIHDCDNKKFTIKEYIRYDSNAHVIDNYELHDYQMEWHSPAPDTVIYAEHKYVCQYTNVQKGNK